MKIIDTHAHVPGRLFGAGPSIAAFRDELESCGVVRTWIFTVDGLIEDPKPNNDRLARDVEPHRDFFVPFCTVNPYEGAEAAIAELERCHQTLGMRGLKLHPWLQAFPMCHPAIVPLFQAAGRLGMPVIVHDGTPPYCTPLQIAAAAEKTPETTVILGHAGLDDLTNDAILACLRHPNVFLSCTSLSIGPIGDVLRRCPRDKILYGSDGGLAPDMTAPAIDKFWRLSDDQDLLRAVFHDNASRMLT